MTLLPECVSAAVRTSMGEFDRHCSYPLPVTDSRSMSLHQPAAGHQAVDLFAAKRRQLLLASGEGYQQPVHMAMHAQPDSRSPPAAATLFAGTLHSMADALCHELPSAAADVPFPAGTGTHPSTARDYALGTASNALIPALLPGLSTMQLSPYSTCMSRGRLDLPGFTSPSRLVKIPNRKDQILASLNLSLPSHARSANGNMNTLYKVGFELGFWLIAIRLAMNSAPMIMGCVAYKTIRCLQTLISGILCYADM